MNSIEITFDNGGSTFMLLDPADFIKVSMDKSRPSNPRVRLVYLEPFTRNVKSLDMLFMGPDVPKGHVGPFVTSVSWDPSETAGSPEESVSWDPSETAGSPEESVSWDPSETAGSPEDIYAMLRSKALGAKDTRVTDGTPGTQGTKVDRDDHMDSGEVVHGF